MCGRLNVIEDPLTSWVSEALGIAFDTVTNNDLRPTQSVDTIAHVEGSYIQLGTTWGIKPNWSKKIIINAQGETAAEKKTFKQAFANQRCLVPCSGWYEWKAEDGNKKQKYSFTHTDSIPFLMGGIWFENELGTELVTLTTEPNKKCAEIHKRMPVIVHPEEVDIWLQGAPEDVQVLINPIDDRLIKLEVA